MNFLKKCSNSLKTLRNTVFYFAILVTFMACESTGGDICGMYIC